MIFAQMLAQKIGVAHPAIIVERGHRKEPTKKQRQRMRHVITRDASPYVASLLEISGFSFGSIRERRSLAPLRRRGRSPRPTIGRESRHATLYGTATRSQMHHGDSKDFSPSNAWNDSKTAVLRQLPQTAVLVITCGQRQCRYTEWVSVGIPTVPRGSGHCPTGLASVQVSTHQNARLHSALCKVALAEVQVCTTANANLSRCGSSLALRQLQTCTSHSP